MLDFELVWAVRDFVESSGKRFVEYTGNRPPRPDFRLGVEDPARGGDRALPVAKVLTDPVQHPLSDLNNEVRFLGDRDKVRGQDYAAFRQFPAHECFSADDRSGLDVVLRLVMNQQFVPLKCALELALRH